MAELLRHTIAICRLGCESRKPSRWMSSRARHRRLDRQRRQQGHADVGGDHLPQRFQAGGLEAAHSRPRRPAGTRPAPGRAGSGRPRAAAGARRRVPSAPANRVAASGCASGTASRKGSSNRNSTCSWSSCTGNASSAGIEPALAQPRQQHVGSSPRPAAVPAAGSACGCRGTTCGSRYGPERGEHAQPHRAGFRILAAARDLLHLLDVGDDAARALGDLAPGRGQHHLARRAFDQRHAELVFELADLRGERRLADEAGRGGAAEVRRGRRGRRGSGGRAGS